MVVDLKLLEDYYEYDDFGKPYHGNLTIAGALGCQTPIRRGDRL
jgi:hypothetical protein